MTRGFLDSNVLLYSIDLTDDRRNRAEELVDRNNRIGVQCLNEFASVAHRKLKMSWSRIDEALAIFVAIFPAITPVTMTIHRRGLTIAECYRLSLYDSLIVAAAIEADCDILYSEDMQDGLIVDGRLRIENPFAQTPG